MNPRPLPLVKPHTSLNSLVTDNIRAEMARRRVTQKDLANLLGLSQSRVSARISGKSPWQLDDLIPVAEALGVSIDVLIYGGGYENTPAPLDAEVLSSPNWIRTSNPSVNGFKQVERPLPIAA